MNALRCLLLFIGMSACAVPVVLRAQERTDTAPRMVVLPEVRVQKHETRIVHFKTKGYPSYRSFAQGDAYLSLLEGLPAGQLAYIEFFFNTGLPNLLPKKLHIDYRDVELQLLLYKVTDQNMMGDPLLDSVWRFTVPHDHEGAYRIPLASLHIGEERLLVGFRVLSATEEGKSNIYVRLNEVHNGLSFEHYGRFAPSGWRRHVGGDQFKLKVGVLQQH